jgi:hypothetical protein
MSDNHYMINMQKLLYVVKELHIRGFERMRVIPHLSPTGLTWRCNFVSDTDLQRETIASSNWIQNYFSKEKNIEFSIIELTDLFERENANFLNACKGKNKEYVDWYSDMLNKLKEGELPYAFAEYFSPVDYWKTSAGQEISTLPNEKRYYVNY